MQNKAKDTTKKKPISPEQRSRRMQQVMFSVLAGIIIIVMILSMVAR